MVVLPSPRVALAGLRPRGATPVATVTSPFGARTGSALGTTLPSRRRFAFITRSYRPLPPPDPR